MLLKKRWDISRYNAHRHKVNHSSPVIDNKPPETYIHLHLNLKKMQKEEERSALIDKENRLLLEKMSSIMRTRGSVDNRNSYLARSLNKTLRQRELLRVTHENQAILKRITSKEPHYNHLQWEEEWQMNMLYMNNISKYPQQRRDSCLARQSTHGSLQNRQQSTK
ncbi:carboxypeptidase E-like [Paramuricea clavata]|uniref:Carboxypeptidase E-like n=1 Tax=Paramuricea clavata TaxID=317549 RepID=A0A7D9HWM2_PARCT|nr:carboxypeptidase E-like [Paramuricea clavata]